MNYFPISAPRQTSTRQYEHPGFIVRLIMENNEIIFEPNLEDFINVILNMYDVMVKLIGIIPRIESKLYATMVKF